MQQIIHVKEVTTIIQVQNCIKVQDVLMIWTKCRNELSVSLLYIMRNILKQQIWSCYKRACSTCAKVVWWMGISYFPMAFFSICFVYDFVKPLKIWAHLDNFFFIVSKGGPKEKYWKIAKTIHWFFSIFPLVPPWKLWKKKLSK